MWTERMERSSGHAQQFALHPSACRTIQTTKIGFDDDVLRSCIRNL